MKYFYWLIHTVICVLYKNTYKKYMHNHNIAKVQEEKLRELISLNVSTNFGKRYNFKIINTIEAYQKTVPLSSYEDYQSDIDKIANGESSILTSEDVLLLEPTSGSTSTVKLIPYTKGLKAEFQEGIKVWLYYLYHQYPELKYGKSYWSITPSLYEKQVTRGNIPIGFEKDCEYLGKLEAYFMEKILVLPKGIAQEKDTHAFYLKTAICLLSSSNVRLISIWSPTFLLLLLHFIDENRDSILKQLDYKNSCKIENVFNVFDRDNKKNYCLIWQELKVISCWGDAHSASYLKILEEYFPSVAIEPKGILATEGILSIPLGDKEGSRLSYYSHFYEFLEEKTQKIFLAHELEKDHFYEAIITTSGGLYRYQTGDIIHVKAIKNNIPIMKFVGRKGLVSDFYGEKLSEAFISQAFQKWITTINKRETFEEKQAEKRDVLQFFMIAPDYCLDAHSCCKRYVFYYKGGKTLAPEEIDTILRSNFHYDYCRKLGQLEEVVLFRLTGNPEKEYIQHYVDKGMRLGDIKLKTLSLEKDWHTVFTGYWQAEQK